MSDDRLDEIRESWSMEISMGSDISWMVDEIERLRAEIDGIYKALAAGPKCKGDACG